MKSDGSWTYFAPDIAYHYDKVQRGFDELIDIFGADHGGVALKDALVAALETILVEFRYLQAIAQKLADLPSGSRVLGFNYDTGERYLSVADFLPE